MSTLIQDLRYALRLMLKQPGFTAIVVVSIALAIGANTMIFSLVNGLLLRTLPYTEPERMVVVWFTPPNQPETRSVATHSNCNTIRKRSVLFEHVGCALSFVTTNMSEEGSDAASAERLIGGEFTADLPETLGVKPIMGRWFTAAEEQTGADPAVVISYPLWQRRFAGSRDVIGRKVHVTTQSAGSDIGTIIGVMPDGFEFFNSQAEYWMPFMVPRGAERSVSRRLIVAGRLKPGATIQQAQSEMDAFAAGFIEENPAYKGWGTFTESLHDAYTGPFTSALNILQGAVAFVLLIACANVAGLLLAQGATQHKELAIRSALGSSRSRLIRQLLTGNVLLAILGGLFGLAIGWAGLRVLLNSLPPGMIPANRVELDSTVLGFTAILSVATGLIFGILPALQVSRPDLMEALRDSSRSATAGGAKQRLRSILVVGQISLALVLLIGAGLMIKSFLRLYAVDPGFDTRNLMSFQIQLGDRKFIRDTGNTTPVGSAETELSPALNSMAEQIRERLSGIPAVEAAAMMSPTAPLSGGARGVTFTIDGKQAPPEGQQALAAQWYPISPRYFETLKLPVLRGREFNARDTLAGQAVLIINSTMASRYWPNEDPIGKRVKVTYFNDPVREIVGVVGDVHQNTYAQQMQSQMYLPYAQLPLIQEGRVAHGLESQTYIVRSAGSSEQIVPSLRAALGEVDPSQPIFNMKTIESYLSDQLQGDTQFVMLLGIFGVIAVVLAIGGIYGIMSHSVTQRTGEIGIRMALGAGSRQVLGLVFRRGVVLIAIGLVIGFAASLALTRVIENMLFGVTPTDPVTFAVVVLVLAGIALFACYIPARRALKVNPIVALRNE